HTPDPLDRRSFCDERADLDAFLHLAKRVADVERDEPEQAEREQRKGDGRDAERTEQRCTSERREGGFEGEHQSSPIRTGAASAESNTSSPWLSSRQGKSD